MSTPSDKTHRRNRRRLGMGQYPRGGVVVVTPTPSGNTVSLGFSRSVVIPNAVPFDVATLSIVSQEMTSGTSVFLTFSGPVQSLAWNFHPETGGIQSTQGATVLPSSGVFAVVMPIAANNILVADGAGGMIGGRGTLNADNSASLGGGALTITPTGRTQINGICEFGGGLFLGAINFTDQVIFSLPAQLAGIPTGSLPIGPEGAAAYANDGCKVGETPGAGTGVPVYYSQGEWRVFSTDLLVQS